MRGTRSIALALLLVIVGCKENSEIPQPSSLVAAYPNPMKNMLFVTVNNNTGASAQLIVFDTKGDIVADNTFGDGLNQIQFDVSKLPDGRFHIICKAGDQVHTTEVLKK
jgi:hypothetical protein